MPRVEIPGFVGGIGRLRGRQIGVEDGWNYIVFRTAPTHGKTADYIQKIPGVTPFLSVPGATSVRGLFSENGRAFVGAGGIFTEFFADGTLRTPFVPIVEDANPVTISSGGANIVDAGLLVVSGGTGIVWDLVTNTQIPISAPGLELPYSMGTVIDLYGIVVKFDSIQFNFSNLNNFSVFDAADFAARSEASDNISAIVRNHRELWVLGQLTTEVWQDTGDVDTPFAPIPGVFLEQGCIAPYSALSVDNTVFWLGRNVQGGGIVYRANGYTPDRVSHDAIELALSLSADLTRTIGWSMQMDGQTFYGLYVPDLPEQLVYNIATASWTRWARWNPQACVWFPWFARCHCDAFGKHLVADWSSGTIYEVSARFYGNTVMA